MLEELDALGARLGELAGHVRRLRDENLQLRAQLSASQAELAALHERVALATRRIEALISQLPAEVAQTDPA